MKKMMRKRMIHFSERSLERENGDEVEVEEAEGKKREEGHWEE